MNRSGRASPLVVLRRGETDPPLVLVHGFTGRPESWAETAALLPGDRAAAALTLPGHDPDVSAEGSCASFETSARALCAACEASGLAGAHLAGYSMGARVALGMLVNGPGVFSGATLVGVHPGLSDRHDRGARREDDETWCRLLEQRGIHAFVQAWEARSIFSSQSRVPAARRNRQRTIRLGHRPEALADALRRLGLGAMPDYRPQLASLPMPVRLVAGGEDGRFVGLIREIAPLIPRVETVIVPSCGHNVLLERPETVASLLATP